MPQIATAEIKKLGLPLLSRNEEKTLFLNFNNEIEMYNKITNLEQNIKQLHNEFLGNKLMNTRKVKMPKQQRKLLKI
jgi:hypothetical protein